MIPASAVRSPMPVTSTRNEPEPLTVPAITLCPSASLIGRDSPVIIDSLTAFALTNHSVGWNCSAGTHQDQVACTQVGYRQFFDVVADDAGRHIG